MAPKTNYDQGQVETGHVICLPGRDEPFTGFGGKAGFYYLQNQKIMSLLNAPVKSPNYTVSNITNIF